MSLRTTSFAAALLATVLSTRAGGDPVATVPAPAPAVVLHPRRAGEVRAILALRIEAGHRIAALLARIEPLPPGPDREALLRETAAIKRELRVAELQTIAALARESGDEARAQQAERALAGPPRPAPLNLRQTPDKQEVAR